VTFTATSLATTAPTHTPTVQHAKLHVLDLLIPEHAATSPTLQPATLLETRFSAESTTATQLAPTQHFTAHTQAKFLTTEPAAQAPARNSHHLRVI
jgi:hypothetical protein